MVTHGSETDHSGDRFPPAGPTPPSPATGLRRLLFLGAGFVCVGLAYLGVLLLVVGATVLMLIALAHQSIRAPRSNPDRKVDEP